MSDILRTNAEYVEFWREDHANAVKRYLEAWEAMLVEEGPTETFPHARWVADTCLADQSEAATTFLTRHGQPL